MSERKFARALGKVGSAAQVRETVSKAVRTKTVYQNKSLLVDCSPETTEYSQRKYYILKRLPNQSNSFDTTNGDDLADDNDGNCLFVRECLKTYNTAFLHISYEEDPSSCKLLPSTSSPEPSILVQPPTFDAPVILRHSSTGNVSNISTPSSSGSSTGSTTKPPDWFWSQMWTESREIKLDEAGVALQGRLGIIYAGENLGERFVQIKWDIVEEKFLFIVWATDAGKDFVYKLNLGDADPVWHNDLKLTLDHNLVLLCEQRKGFLRDVYSICAELGVYERAERLVQNVHRVHQVVKLFQRAAAELPTRGDSKVGSRCSSPGAKNLSTIWVTIKLDALDFRLKTESNAPVEPYFLSLCLYDVKNGRKISEDFRTTIDTNGVVVGSPKALFRISEANDQIFAFLRVEKTLQAGDIDYYLQGGKADGKSGSRISKSILTSPLFTKDQRYRMPLCYSTRCLFKKVSGNIDESGFALDQESTFTPMYKHEKSSEEDLLK